MQARVGIYPKGELKLEDLLEQLKTNERFKEIGGIGIFIGIARATSSEGQPVSHLELEAFEGKAEEAMASVADDISARNGIIDVLIHHVVGRLEQGDTIMTVLVAGRSRKEIFPALMDAVEKTKNSVPIWKKEHLVSGESYWVGEKDRAGGSGKH